MIKLEIGTHAPAHALQAAGYTHTAYHPEEWEDVGTCESGPRLVGCPAANEWTDGTNVVFVTEDDRIASCCTVQEQKFWAEFCASVNDQF